jgi:UDPglucose 6-dehydrogenase
MRLTPDQIQVNGQTAETVLGYGAQVFRFGSRVDDAKKGGDIDLLLEADHRVGKHFALWGLAFKANTDDMRQASNRIVITDLLAAGATITAYDSVAMDIARCCYPNEPNIRYAENQTAALAGADAPIIVTEWKEFRSPDFAMIKATLKSPVIFDGRNLYEPKLVRGIGLEYSAIGR